jgi:sulfite reductase (NADPH) flavoprotein alpha-component
MSGALVLGWAGASVHWLGLLRRARPVRAECIIAHASQTGTAEQLAGAMKAQLDAARKDSALVPLADLDEAALDRAKRLILVASTTGEGEAPDGVRSLEKGLLAKDISLSHLEVLILALGDRSYRDFCAYGLRLGEWAERAGARVSLVSVDNRSAADLAEWDRLMIANGLPGLGEAGDDGVIEWTLDEPEELSPGDDAPIKESRPGPLFHVRLRPRAGAMPDFAVGDLFEWHGADGARRDFSIASLPADDSLGLVIRRVELPGGAMGRASNALTVPGARSPIRGRIRTYANFHETAGKGPLLAIAAGSGWGGVRAHVISAIAKGRPVWLLYGERGPSGELGIFAEMRKWHQSGRIRRLGLALSRGGGDGPLYVQDCVERDGAAIADFLGEDGAVAICGAAAMGEQVENALEKALSREWVIKARADQRWRAATY